MIPLASLAYALLIVFLKGLCFFHVRYPPLVSHKDAEEKKCYNEAMLEQIDDYLHSYAPELQAIICTLCEIARKSMPEAHEMIYHSAIGYSVTTSPFDRICYIAPQQNYVNFGFFFGTHLPDPHHILVGEGQRMRHVKVRSLEDASNPALEQLMKEAWKDGPLSIANLHRKKGKGG